ncbi:MAG: hypothetical protein ACK4N6_00295 [Rhodocyclaceae bacterium]
MFESAEISHEIDKTTWKSAQPPLRTVLLDAQYELDEQGRIPLIVSVSERNSAGQDPRRKREKGKK